jgi:hypothetical protein
MFVYAAEHEVWARTVPNTELTGQAARRRAQEPCFGKHTAPRSLKWNTVSQGAPSAFLMDVKLGAYPTIIHFNGRKAWGVA